MISTPPQLSRAAWQRLGLLSWLWGSEFLFVAIALRHMGSIQLTFFRLVLAAGLLFGVVLLSRERWPRDRMFYVHCVISGIAGTFTPYFLMAVAQEHISSALTGILVGSSPLLTALLASLFLPSEHVTSSRVLGFMVGLVGVVFVINPWNADVSGDMWGALAAIGVAFFFAVNNTYNARFLAGRSASGPLITGLQSTVSFMLAGAIWLAFGSADVSLSGEAWAAVLTLGLVNTGAAAIVFFSLLRLAGSVGASLVEYFMVLVAVLLGVTFLDESVSALTGFGVVLVLGGVFLAERRSSSGGSTQVTDQSGEI
jgi:drug/metabolite transporter (DMT)-like permease